MTQETIVDQNKERLKLLMSAVRNGQLDGEVCPNCFELFSVPSLRAMALPIFTIRRAEGASKSTIGDALTRFRGVKEKCVLRKANIGDDILNEYECGWCKRRYLGQIDLVANQAETRVLSFFGYDDNRVYQKDFYPFSILEDSYGSLVEKLWEQSGAINLTPRSVRNSLEDVITGRVLDQLEAFFLKFVEVVYEDLGASVKVYTDAQAGAVESGRGSELPPSGADLALWVGPLTTEDVQEIDAFMNLEPGSELPLKVGNGAIFQAKKLENGVLDAKQTEDLVRYASLTHNGHNYFGIPGKLYMKYSPQPPFVTTLPCDFTYSLFSSSIFENKKKISFKKALNKLAPYAAESNLTDFVKAYLSGKAGTPLLLHDVFGTPGPKLVIGLPPESLNSPTPKGHALMGVLDSWCAAFCEALNVEATGAIGVATVSASEVKEAEENAYVEENVYVEEKVYLNHS